MMAEDDASFEAHVNLELINLYRLTQPAAMGSCFTKQGDEDDFDEKAEFVGGNVHIITTKDQWDQKIAEATKTGKLVVANFSAVWCGPCKMIAPMYVELSENYPSFMFLTVDVDEMADFSSELDVRATPTFFFLKEGKQVDKLVGANRPELEKKLVAFSDTSQVKDG
ncbi:Thioredoxin [Rhynchospora pubera]|uniref:Thioredoxin n=2 Tax=Rhynchospora pubera TaxID=906938 RepID=A0AAV8D211_9POAL|nr:Thioredoxin [Rhynchospora pubera]